MTLPNRTKASFYYHRKVIGNFQFIIVLRFAGEEHLRKPIYNGKKNYYFIHDFRPCWGLLQSLVRKPRDPCSFQRLMISINGLALFILAFLAFVGLRLCIVFFTCKQLLYFNQSICVFFAFRCFPNFSLCWSSPLQCVLHLQTTTISLSIYLYLFSL